MQDFDLRNVSVEALGQLLTITKALATFTSAENIAEAKAAAQAYARTVGPKGSLQEASNLIAIARQEKNLQRQSTQGAKEIIADAREQLARSEGLRWESRAQEERDAAKAAIRSAEQILQEEIEADARVQAKKYSDQINDLVPRARSNAGETEEERTIADGVLSWIAKQRRRGIRD